MSSILKEYRQDSFQLILNPEYFRVAAYGSIIIGLLFGYILTSMVNIQRGWIDPDKSKIMETFGYNNLCFYIDERPGKYVGLFACTDTINKGNSFDVLQLFFN